MSVRMFDEFQKKNTAFNFRKVTDVSKEMTQFRIAIPLKNS